MPAGQQVKVELYRNGKTMELPATVQELPDKVARASGPSLPEPPEAPTAKNLQLLRRIGLEEVEPLTRQTAQRSNLKFTPGVLVTEVRPDSAAAAAPILRGTIITDVMGVVVKTPDELAKELAKHDLKKGVRLGVIDQDQPRFVLLEMAGP
jgi:S1-C subfamily serine protease